MALDTAITCPECGFVGDVESLELLSNVRFVLGELDSWSNIPPDALKELRQEYEGQLRELELALGLRELPFDADGARQARLALAQLNGLHSAIPYWVRSGMLTEEVGQAVAAEATERALYLQERLIGAPATEIADRPKRRLAQMRFLAETLDQLNVAGRLAGESAYAATSARYAASIEATEIEMGLRSPRTDIPPPAAVLKARPPRQPRQPLTWDRVWETLLSERTLRAMLFLGTALLFAAAVSLVVWNWEAFPPWLQVFFLALITAVFYGIGWFVRVRTGLRQSGIALSAVASLLVPLDFYAFYLSGGFPSQYWAEVWLLASSVCLGAYLITVYLVEAEFFGYLVGVAAGSLLAAAFQVSGVGLDWWQTGLMVLALALAAAAEVLHRRRTRWKIMAGPLWHVVLVGAPSILLLGIARRILGRDDSTAFGTALALDWWLGGVLFLLAATRYRTQLVGVGAALCFPVATWLSQAVAFSEYAIGAAWHSVGFALLVPAYLLVGRVLTREGRGRDNELAMAYGRMAVAVAVLLGGLAAAVSLAETAAVAWVHPFLVVATALAVALWTRPWLALLASALALSSSAAWMASANAGLGQLGLGWALLAVGHLILALLLRRFGGGRAGWAFHVPLFVGGWAIAAFSLLPPLIIFERSILTYALGNWIAVNGWLAILAHGDEAPRLREFLAVRRVPVISFHWLAAVSLPVWLGLVWTGRRAVGVEMALMYCVAAWALLFLGTRLRQVRWRYGFPWYLVAHVCNVLAVGVAAAFYEQVWMAVVLLIASAFYFIAARVQRWRWLLAAGGLVFPVGCCLGLDWLGVAEQQLGVTLASIATAYVIGAGLLERFRIARREFLLPLYATTLPVAYIALGWTLSPVFGPKRSDAALLWAALGQLLLGIASGVYAWLSGGRVWAHLAAWLGVMSGGLVAMAYSQGRGSSAAKAALLAIAYVAAERGLSWASRAERIRTAWRPLARQAWRLYRRPLLVAGWVVSVGSILLALVRNLVLLGGGQARETWSVVGLLLVCGLYAVSSRLFRQPRFVWFASALVVIPWTLLTHLGWFIWSTPQIATYGLSWCILASALLLLGIWLTVRTGFGSWGRPLRVVANLLFPFALLWGAGDVPTSAVTAGLGVAFYAAAAWADRFIARMGTKEPRERYAYPASALIPVWSVYLLAHFAPDADRTAYGLLLLGFALLSLLIGVGLERRAWSYSRPLLLVAVGTGFVGTLVFGHERPLMIGALLYDAVLVLLGAWLRQRPRLVYPATVLVTLALLLALAEYGVPSKRYGWALTGMGGVYLLLHQVVQRWSVTRVQKYAKPLLRSGLLLVALGLPWSSLDRTGALFGYGGAALLYAISAVLLRAPVLFLIGTGLAIVPYWMAILELGISPVDRGLALWPGIVLALVGAYVIDRRWGIKPLPDDGMDGLEPFSWSNPARWGSALLERLTRWWALPLYVAAYGGACVSGVLSLADSGRLAAALALAAVTYGLATVRFRRRSWLFATAVTAQLAFLAAIHWLDWARPAARAALAFAPVTWATAFVALGLERRLQEGSPIVRDWRQTARGWSRPLYALLLVDLVVGQAAAMDTSGAGAAVSLSHAVLVGLFATVWRLDWLAYVSPGLALLGLAQQLLWREADVLVWPLALTLLGLAYGLTGYLLRFLCRRGMDLPDRVRIWENPFVWGGWLVSSTGVILALFRGVNVYELTFRAVFRMPLVPPADLPQVQMVVGVLALAGLLWLAASLVERWRWLGYGAVAALLTAWSLEWLLVWGMREVQWYAVPAGAYLLLVGYLEWNHGSRAIARWVDRAALLLLLGSSFWQSLGEGGWRYALLMGGEGLAIVWWGSARRLRRFLYIGVVGVILDIAGQLIEPLLSVNRWIVFGVIGTLLVSLAILVERRLEAVMALSKELRQRLERWE